MSEALAWLEPILTRKREDGSFYYSNEDVARFIPVFLLTMGVDPRTLPPHIATVVADFAAEAGVKPGMNKQRASAAMQEYLAANPLNQELVFEMRRGMREDRSTGSRSVEDRGRAAAKLIGAAVSQRIAAAPAGAAVRGGPLARFALQKKIS